MRKKKKRKINLNRIQYFKKGLELSKEINFIFAKVVDDVLEAGLEEGHPAKKSLPRTHPEAEA